MKCNCSEGGNNCASPLEITRCRKISKNILADLGTGPIFWNNNANIDIPLRAIEESQKHNVGLNAITKPPPTKWSWMNYNENIISRGKENQRNCGCCWAYSLANVLSDRYAIKYKMKSPQLSPLFLISCSNNSESGTYKLKGFREQSYSNFPSDNTTQCDCGGNSFLGAKYLEENNIMGTQKCWNFDNIVGNGKSIPPCLKNSQIKCYDCDNQNPLDLARTFGVKKDSTKILVVVKNNNIDITQTILNIKKEIIRGGPVLTSFRVPQDFMNWWNTSKKTDIYKNIKNEFSGNHAVALVGWGKENDTEYWLMRNTWGKSHDGVGYCRIAITSPQDNPNNYMGLDIPIKRGNFVENWMGGAITLEAGDLPQEWINEKDKVKIETGNVGESDDNKNDNKNDNNGGGDVGGGDVGGGDIFVEQVKLFFENIKKVFENNPVLIISVIFLIILLIVLSKL